MNLLRVASICDSQTFGGGHNMREATFGGKLGFGCAINDQAKNIGMHESLTKRLAAPQGLPGRSPTPVLTGPFAT